MMERICGGMPSGVPMQVLAMLLHDSFGGQISL
jgi:hypothetical protein